MVYRCKCCQAQVEYAWGLRRWMDVATGGPHFCERIPEIPDQVECMYCGTHIDRYQDGRRFDPITGEVHHCARSPQPPATPRARSPKHPQATQPIAPSRKPTPPVKVYDI